jgi:plastocyanin
MNRNRFFRAAGVTAIVLAVAVLVPRVAGDALADRRGPDAGVREIRLVARDMTFYVDGEKTPNPTLEARPGERIRLVLRNADAGMSHDFAVRDWSVGTRLLDGKGQDQIEFTVPDASGSYTYSCTPHAAMMRGTIDVK